MIRFLHTTRLPDGSTAEHEGERHGCRAPECQFPQLEAFVTMSGIERSGVLKEKTDTGGFVVTYSGDSFMWPLGELREAEWGTYCPHGVKLVEAVPAAHRCGGRPGPLDDGTYCQACYPNGRKIQPWPCEMPGCSEKDFDRAEQEALNEHHEELNRLLWDTY